MDPFFTFKICISLNKSFWRIVYYNLHCCCTSHTFIIRPSVFHLKQVFFLGCVNSNANKPNCPCLTVDTVFTLHLRRYTPWYILVIFTVITFIIKFTFTTNCSNKLCKFSWVSTSYKWPKNHPINFPHLFT